MSDDDILHAAQQRLDARRNAMTPDERRRFIAATEELVNAVAMTQEESRKVWRQICAEIDASERRGESR